MRKNKKVFGSFRDPSGSLFLEKNELYRQINKVYQKHYDYLMSSGLYDELVGKELLIPHQEIKKTLTKAKIYKIIKPEPIPFISYPYEWCFGQLKDAALVTLRIQRLALKYKMTLKDASAYNIQFRKGKPILIDTLSFEIFEEGKPWVAYRQFCQHFLAPLLLMSYRDVRLNWLLKVFIDGIPLDLASTLLPARSYFNFSILTHLHLHAQSEKFFEDKGVNTLKKRQMGKNSYLGMIENLENTVRKISRKKRRTEWANYYQETNYSESAMKSKRYLVKKYLEEAKPKETVWDLGSNTGFFSRLASEKGLKTVSFDIDPVAVEKNYHQVNENSEENLLPLIMDFCNPSSGIGWESKERMSLMERGPADCVLALALVHHLAISNNLPFERIARFLVDLCTWLIIEFVPKTDSNVQRLLRNREDVFPNYTKEEFEKAFQKHFRIKKVRQVQHSRRVLYLMRRK